MGEAKENISQLGYSLLGLIAMQPSTGYELRKVFETTPMGRYSSSPGAIYPALKKLQAAGAVKTREIMGKTSRAASQLSITAKGTSTLEVWLRRIPTAEEVGRDLDGVLLRFSYLDILGDLDFSLRYLNALEALLEAHLRSVAKFRKGAEANMPLHGDLALALGESTLKAHLSWAKNAVRAIAARIEQRGDP